jgi:hypothetical protein
VLYPVSVAVAQISSETAGFTLMLQGVKEHV